MDWVTSALTILQMHLVARGRWYGWLVGLVNQGCWIWLAGTTGLHGLYVLSAVLALQYAWAMLAWLNVAPRIRPRRIVLDLDSLDYDAIQQAIAKQQSALGFPPDRGPYGHSNAAGEAVAEICRAWDELRSYRGMRGQGKDQT